MTTEKVLPLTSKERRKKETWKKKKNKQTNKYFSIKKKKKSLGLSLFGGLICNVPKMEKTVSAWEG